MLAQTARMGLLGLGIGVGLAAGTIRLLSSILYGVIQLDLATFVLLPILLGLATMIAGYVPAQRAVRTDPAITLRNE